MPNKKISEFPINLSPTGDNIFPVVASGITTQLSLSALTTFVSSGLESSNAIFTDGLTANTISATTYLNLPSGGSGGGFSGWTGGSVSNSIIVNNANNVASGNYSFNNSKR